MSPNNLQVFKIISGVIAGIFTLLSAFFGFWDVLQDNDQGKIREWFRRKWVVISSSRWISMPEKVIDWFLNFIDSLRRIDPLNGFFFNSKFNIYHYFSILIGFLIYIILTFNKNIYINLIYIFCIFSLFFFCILWIVITIKKIISFGEIKIKNLNKSNVFLLNSTFYILALILIMLLIIEKNVYLITFTSLYLSLLLLISIMVVIEVMGVNENFGFSLGFARYFIAHFDDYMDYHAVFFYLVSFSFIITLFALMIGHIVSPSAYLPQTFQMLFSNVICDGLTIVATILILSKIVKGTHLLLKIPLAILLDIIIAALLAISSLYFGLVFTKNALSIREILYILIAKSPQGNTIELGPYFWAMHTTFLPTIFYLFIILVCWVGKALLIPVRGFFGVGKEHSSPLKLTAALCGVFAAFFGVLALFPGLVKLL